MQDKKRAQWIWYPRDFELMLAQRMMARRYYREIIQPPIWRVDDCWKCVKFARAFTLEADDEIEIRADGEFNLELDVPGVFVKDFDGVLRLPAGEHTLCIAVYNPTGLPALFVRGKELISDERWNVTCHDSRWFPAALWNFDEPDCSPNDFKLPERPMQPASVREREEGLLIDFGRESFGRVVFEGVRDQGELNLFFGESLEEALDTEECELTERILVAGDAESVAPAIAKGFRYVLVKSRGVSFKRVTGREEYLPLERKGRFFSSNERLNRIWEVSLDTLALCSREFFLDGIKRDRWVWSGDAVQSYLMNYYSFFDTGLVRRTTAALRGKEPVAQHVNTIMDYSFYWLIALADYWNYTGDLAFIEEYWERAESLLAFCLARRNEDGLMVKYPEDWVFVDWSEGIDNEGLVCCEQMLLSESLKRMADLAQTLNKRGRADEYRVEAARVDAAIEREFWDESAGCYRYSSRRKDGASLILKQPNLFALKFGYCEGARRESILKNIFDNPDITPITTPYMRFYEYEAMCREGRHRQVLEGILSYWGGMLDEGATSFWELYRPDEHDAQHLTMYGRPYGRSLCHAWGASPIYLLGRFFVGVEPAQPGYGRFRLSPHLGGLDFFEAEMPTAGGSVALRMDGDSLRVQSRGVDGELTENAEFSFCGKFAGRGSIKIERDREYLIPIQIKK